jgi:glycoprotease/Kae1 family metallohydrolase
MITLGIETTAHTFGVGIVDDKGTVLANEHSSFTTMQKGMIPAKVADHHYKVWKIVLQNALKKAELEMSQIDLIAFSQGPGMGHTLRVGTFIARCIAHRFSKPIVGVNHCIAHMSIGIVRTGAKDPVLLYASGANTQIIVKHLI